MYDYDNLTPGWQNHGEGSGYRIREDIGLYQHVGIHGVHAEIHGRQVLCVDCDIQIYRMEAFPTRSNFGYLCSTCHQNSAVRHGWREYPEAYTLQSLIEERHAELVRTDRVYKKRNMWGYS
jgi:hypothetical protein